MDEEWMTESEFRKYMIEAFKTRNAEIEDIKRRVAKLETAR